MNPSYQPSVVALSIIIAILVSYLALVMGRRIALAQSRAVKFWVLGGSVSMGIGIWAMHFIGMLAFHLPIPLAYDPGITLLSIVPAILASAIALVTMRFKDESKYLFYIATLLMGLGIVVMHYSGMEALKMEPSIDYDPLLFGLSVVIAIIASGAALYLAFQGQTGRQDATLRHVLSAIVMGFAISGMHYTGMWAARFPVNGICMAVQSGGLESSYLIALVSAFTILVLGSTAVVMFIDSIRSQNVFYETLLNAQSDIGEGVYIVEYGKPVFANQAMTEITGYGQSELLSMNFFLGLIVETDRNKVAAYLAIDSENQLTHRCEVGIFTRNNLRKEVELAITSFLYADRVRQLVIVLDISERRTATRSLEEQKAENALLARVAEHTDNAVIITNSKGRIQWVNAGFTRITDYESLEAIGRKPSELLQGEDTDPETVAYIREKIKMGEGFSAEIVNYSKDGRKYWIAINVQPIRNRSGEVEQFIAIERDITDWKNAMALLEKQKAESEMLAKVAATTDNSVIILDPQGRTEWVNEGFTRIYGYKLEELIGRRPGELIIGPETKQKTIDYIRGRISKGQSFSTESINYDKSGNRHWVSLDGQPILNVEGEVERIFIIESDITEQKQIQIELETLNQTLEQRVTERTEELEGQRQFIETVLDTAGSLILVLNNEGRIMRFNPACEKMTGFDLSKKQDRPFWEYLISPDQWDMAKQIYYIPDNNSLTPTWESRIMTCDDQEHIIAWNNSTIRNNDGMVQYVIMIGIDISKRKLIEHTLKDTNNQLQDTITSLKAAQSQLVQSEKMASLGGLVAGISHEVNTPIGIAVTSASNLDEELDLLALAFRNGTMKKSALEGFIAHAKQASAILQKNLKRASELISSFKQVAVDQSSDTWRTIDIYDYVDEVVTSLRPKWKGKSIKIINNCDRNLIGYSYPGAIYQVLSNLLLNSLMHAFETDEPGEIRFQGRVDNGYLELTYHDGGKGIPEEFQNKVFDPFFTTRRGHGGSGLGLHIVFNLVNTSLNGQIKLHSSAGDGTTFIITFPFSKQENRPGESA